MKSGGSLSGFLKRDQTRQVNSSTVLKERTRSSDSVTSRTARRRVADPAHRARGLRGNVSFSTCSGGGEPLLLLRLKSSTANQAGSAHTTHAPGSVTSSAESCSERNSVSISLTSSNGRSRNQLSHGHRFRSCWCLYFHVPCATYTHQLCTRRFSMTTACPPSH